MMTNSKEDTVSEVFTLLSPYYPIFLCISMYLYIIPSKNCSIDIQRTCKRSLPTFMNILSFVHKSCPILTLLNHNELVSYILLPTKNVILISNARDQMVLASVNENT